jgi:5-enolpyruvylshikimate-3-phosphate synthase/chorismate mutase
MPNQRFKKKTTERREGSLFGLEERLVELLAERARILGGRAAERKAAKGPMADPETEKGLWRVWQKAAAEQGLDMKTARRLFVLANGLAYAKARAEHDRRPSVFLLSPNTRPESLETDGPRDRRLARLWTASAAAAGAGARLSPVVLNDPLFELVSALVDAGAGVHRDGPAVVAEQGGAPDFSSRRIFAGADELNLYIMMSLASVHPGRYTLSGASMLKAADLRAAAEGFLGLGVRITSIEPYSDGLPLRLETPGVEKAELRLPEEFPRDAALALAAAGPFFPQGLLMAWESGWSGADFLQEARDLFRLLGVPAVETVNSLEVRPGVDVSGDYDLPLDPVLSAYLLGLCAAAGTPVRLGGRWPQGSLAHGALRLLGSFGAPPRTDARAVVMEPGEPSGKELDASGSLHYLPLALALSLSVKQSGIIVPPGADEVLAAAFLEAFGADLEAGDDRWRVRLKQVGQARGEYAAPDGLWAMAAAVASNFRPGLRLANPGAASETWPGFFRIYMENFRARGEKEESDERRKGKRIRL